MCFFARSWAHAVLIISWRNERVLLTACRQLTDCDTTLFFLINSQCRNLNIE